MFLGDLVSADEAMAMELVDRVVADRDIETTLLELSERLAVAPTRAIALASG